jgi:hypothetical protein
MRPGCTAPGYWCQAHHVEGWAAKDARTEWISPTHLDTGQARMNNYHHPVKYLLPEDGGVP